MDADLVGATGLERARELRDHHRLGEAPPHLVAGPGLLAPLVHGHQGRLARRPADRGVDQARVARRRCPRPARGTAGARLGPRGHRRGRRRPAACARRAGARRCPCRGGGRSQDGRDHPRPRRPRGSARAARARGCRCADPRPGGRPARPACRPRAGRRRRTRAAPPRRARAPAGGPLRGSGRSTSTWSPTASRDERERTGAPPTSTAPASISAATSDRLTPVTIATIRSTRSPAIASGTTSRMITSSPPGGGCCRAPARRSRPTAPRRRG